MRLRLVALVVLLACSGHPPPTSHPVGTGTGSGSGSAIASDKPPTADDPALPLWDQVTKGTLPNGLTYYVLHHAQPQQRAYLWLAVNAGSVLEDDDQQGLAHLCEHMAFNGTTKFPHQSIVDYLEKIGMDFGADVNAQTDFDETVYQLEVPTDKAEYVDTGLDILHDWAGSVTYDPDEVEKERGVVLEEWRGDRGAFARISDKQDQVLFKGTRYAERPPIGKPEIIKHAPRDTVHRFYQDWYRPDLMAVIVVGDLDPATIEKEIADKFGDLSNPANERERIHGGVPDADGMRVSIETDKELPSATVQIENVFPHRRESTAGDYRNYVRDQLYHEMLGERLDSLTRKPDAPFLWAGSSTTDVTRDAESFSRDAGAKQGHVEDALTALLTEVVRVEKHGFTQGELDRAKKNVLRGIEQDARELDKRDGRELVEEIERNFLQGEEMPGRDAEVDLVKRWLPTITLDELDQLAGEWGGDDNRVILLSGPLGEKMPTEARVRELVASVAASDPGEWTEDADATELMTQKPAPGTIASETTDAKHGVTTWKLGNGVRVVVMPTDFENDRVMIRAVSPGGTATAKDKQFASARFAADVIAAGGLGTHSEEELQKLLAGQVASVQPWIDETEEGLNASGSVTDLETLMQLVNLTMTAPRKDEQAFAVWKQSMAEYVANRRVSPEDSFHEDLGLILDGKAKRRLPPEQKDIDQVDLDQALAFYQDRFGDAGDFLFVIVGNVDLASLKPMVAQYLGSLPATKRVEKEKDIGVRPPKGVKKLKVARGQEPKAEVMVTWTGDEKWTRAGVRDLDTLTDVMELTLNDILREDMGGTYGVGVWGEITRSPRQERSVTVDFGCAPENVAALEKALFAEIKRIKKEGVGEDLLDKVRQERKRGREVDLRSNDVWSRWLLESAFYGEDLDTMLDLDANLARISNANLKAAAKLLLPDKRYVEGVLMPEKK